MGKVRKALVGTGITKEQLIEVLMELVGEEHAPYTSDEFDTYCVYCANGDGHSYDRQPHHADCLVRKARELLGLPCD